MQASFTENEIHFLSGRVGCQKWSTSKYIFRRESRLPSALGSFILPARLWFALPLQALTDRCFV